MNSLKLLKIVIFVIGMIAPTSFVNAAEEVEVRAGKKTLIYQYTVFFPGFSCKHTVYPVVRDRNTQHGKITSSPGTFISQSGRCKGKRMKATNIFYTPNSGFRGKDAARVVITYPRDDNQSFGTRSKDVRFKFTVK